MPSRTVLSLRVFGPGRGESILLVVEPESPQPHVFVVDAYATRPYDSAGTNPIIGAQPKAFDWAQVVGVCLTHAHEDHFMGLSAVARRTTAAKWMWPGPTPLDVVVKHYDVLAQRRRQPRLKGNGPRWIADSVRDLASWAATSEPFQIISRRQLKAGSVSLRCLAPSDEVSVEYARQLGHSVDNWIEGKPKAPPDDLHNVPSAGLVLDTAEGVRLVLLGDMVADSWLPVFKDKDLMSFLGSKKADVVKLPHHCSKGAVTAKVLELLCDRDKTRAVFTPFRTTSPPPHDSVVELACDYVKELWCTVTLPRAGVIWRRGRSGDLEADLALRKFLGNPTKCILPPSECMVSFEIDADGSVTVSHGAHAYCIKRVP